MPEDEDRYLHADIAAKILQDAFPSAKHQLCPRRSEATHASAVAGAGVAARGIQVVTRYLWDRLNARMGEMWREEIFTSEVLQVHLEELRCVVASMSGLAAYVAQHPRRYLPETEGVRARIVEARDFVIEHAINPIEAFLRSRFSWYRSGDRLWQLIKKTCPYAMTVVLYHPDMLRLAVNGAGGIAEKLKSDWEKDVASIWQDPHCRGGAA